MDKTQQHILRCVEKQIKKKIALKKGYRKKVKVILEKSSRVISRAIFLSSKNQIRQYNGDTAFGKDDFGRDVEDGLRLYLHLLKLRGVRIHTVIVLGSRVKGTWKPQSDVDITIIADDLPRDGKNFLSQRIFYWRKRFLLSDRPLYMGIEPSGCSSKEEFLKRLRRFDIQALDAVFYGHIIYDDGFWTTVMKEFEEMNRQYGLEQLPLKKLLISA